MGSRLGSVQQRLHISFDTWVPLYVISETHFGTPPLTANSFVKTISPL